MNHKIPLIFVLAILASLAILPACGRNEQGSQPAVSSPPSASPPAGAAPAPTPSPADSALLAPERATAQAPDTYKVRFATTKGDVVVEVRRAWAPHGADRFYNLVQIGYYDGDPLFRVLSGFMAQFGINPNPAVNAKWQPASIPDDPAAGQSNTRGMVTFATSGPDSRTSQVFINYADNAQLDGMGFTPFGKVTAGMDVVDSFYAGYGEGAPSGNGPSQGRLQREGSTYTKAKFPNMDYIKSAKIE